MNAPTRNHRNSTTTVAAARCYYFLFTKMQLPVPVTHSFQSLDMQETKRDLSSNQCTRWTTTTTKPRSSRTFRRTRLRRDTSLSRLPKAASQRCTLHALPHSRTTASRNTPWKSLTSTVVNAPASRPRWSQLKPFRPSSRKWVRPNCKH
jgi:hypothetical protein